MTAPEKAAPIPADDAVDTVAGILASHADRKYITGWDLDRAEEIVGALFVDRASQEERIREDDTERLRWLTRHIPGRVIRETVGVLSSTGDLDEWRASIDRARARQGGSHG